MEIINAKSAETIKNPHNVKVARLYDSEHAQAIHITLEPGNRRRKERGRPRHINRQPSKDTSLLVQQRR